MFRDGIQRKDVDSGTGPARQPLRKAILAKTDTDELERILSNGGHTGMLEDGKRLVADGLTTQEELDKVCGLAGDS
jgi:type II secretory ATPase GspE/PulE/Tfp pilus assembly ATPase PilB-like protein